jgi:hypothetical protein
MSAVNRLQLLADFRRMKSCIALSSFDMYTDWYALYQLSTFHPTTGKPGHLRTKWSRAA